MTKREWNIDEVTNDCIEALKSMDSFDFNTYEAKLKAKGYGVRVMRDSIGKVCGYSIKKGNSTYKASELGHKRSLTPSRLRSTWEKLHRDKGIHTQAINPKGAQSVTRSSSPAATKTVQPKQQSSPKQMPLHPAITSEPVKQQPVMVHHDIEWNGRNYPVDIPKEADEILMKESKLPDNILWSKLVDVQNTAILLFGNYLDAATQMSESCGGGGGASESGWGRKEDEDDITWVRRCAQQAFGMHKRPSRGMHR